MNSNVFDQEVYLQILGYNQHSHKKIKGRSKLHETKIHHDQKLKGYLLEFLASIFLSEPLRIKSNLELTLW